MNRIGNRSKTGNRNRRGSKVSRLLFLVLCFGMLLGLAACGTGEKAEQEGQPQENQTELAELPEVHMGVMYSADIIPLAVMKEQKLDEKHGFLLNMEVFSSAKDRDAAFQAGELDGVFTDYVGVCMYQNAGLDVKITGCTDGDYRLVAGAGIDTGAGAGTGAGADTGAEGNTVAISENTLIEYTLDYLMEKQGYREGVLQKEVVPRIPDRVELLAAGQVDMALLPEPFATLAVQDGGMVLESANENGLYPAVSGFLQTAIEDKREALLAYYEAYDEAVDYVNNTAVEELEDIIIKEAGFPESLRGSIELPVYRKNTLPKTQELSHAIAWSAKKGLCEESLTPEDLLGDLH